MLRETTAVYERMSTYHENKEYSTTVCFAVWDFKNNNSCTNFLLVPATQKERTEAGTDL